MDTGSKMIRNKGRVLCVCVCVCVCACHVTVLSCCVCACGCGYGMTTSCTLTNDANLAASFRGSRAWNENVKIM